ncbi:MAG TPA: hypothetical protein VF210_20125, partial [Pseudomonadales bacterium]
LIDDTDWSSLFDIRPDVLTFRPGTLRLPAGEHDLVVYSVTEDNQWQEIGRTRLRVLTPRGFERAEVAPQVDVTNAGQLLEGHSPAGNLPARERYQDFTVAAALRSTLERNGWQFSTNVGLLGVNTREQAVRFGEAGENAPLVDLASYQLELTRGPIGLSLGHVSFGRHRHLAQGFQSRGPLVSARVNRAVDVTFAAVNGSAIAGFRNPFGLNDRNHQILSAIIGLEAIPSRPGGLRVEATVLDGSVLPNAGFNQGVVNDAEQSRGLGVTVLASDPGQRFRLDAGYSRSDFENPFDPLLASDFDLVPVRRVSRAAQYLDATWMLVQNARAETGRPVNLGLTVRHERVEPLYRSVSAPVRADILQNAVELTGSVGQLNTMASYTWDRDNLADVPSILTTKTRRAALTVAMPVMGLDAPSWSPRVTYTLDRTHQFGAGVPVDGGFNESHVPDQVSAQHIVAIDWQTVRWRAGYRFDRSLQDNRQVGRALSDLFNLANTITAGATPHPNLDLDVELGFDKAENREFTEIDITKRLLVSGHWRVTPASTLAGTVSRTGIRDRAGTGESRATEMHLQWTRTVRLLRRNPRVLNGQFFVRVARQSSIAYELLFGVDDRRSSWSLNTGFNLRIF